MDLAFNNRQWLIYTIKPNQTKPIKRFIVLNIFVFCSDGEP